MKRNLILGLFVLGTLLNASNSFAVESLKGNWSLGLYSALNHSEIETYESDSILISGSLGYFLTDHIEINFSPTFATNETEGAEVNLYNYLGSVIYNFYGSGWQTVPYVGLQTGMTSADFKYEDDSYSDTRFSLGWMAGLKVFLTENLSLDVEFNYMVAIDLFEDLKMSTIFIGFTWYLGGN